ncbi:hypothetical protein BDW69DRAFT_155926 [Aspergillus filifer]
MRKEILADQYGKDIVLRDYTTSIIGWLEKAGDIAIQFAPLRSACPGIWLRRSCGWVMYGLLFVYITKRVNGLDPRDRGRADVRSSRHDREHRSDHQPGPGV